VIDPMHADALEAFVVAAESVAEVLAHTTEWGPSGGRDGQYAVDLRADEACLTALLDVGYLVLSEESGLQGGGRGPIVVVDPLDGSTIASRGIPWCATALCLVDDGGPAVAMVANHATHERTTALRGHGAEHAGRRIAPSGCRDLAAAMIGVSGLPTRHYGWGQFRALGASAPDLCLVAYGALDGWVDMSADAHGVWDYLAAVLICQEAGAAVGEAFDRDLVVLDHDSRRTPVVAATPELLDALLAERRRAD
jgi:myo-inositol-1(or 4)-monophosphatase